VAYYRPVNGAQALIGSLVGAGVDVCFMNPGTSEMHFVSALDSVPEMRGVLALAGAEPDPASATAREQLDVTTVLINNAAYAIMRMELARTAAGQAGQRAARMLDLSDPAPDFTEISTGLGVPATRACSSERPGATCPSSCSG
jgi:thiamine pyrophosphate-dependent acetolactate synthase large subunit-like protein